MPGLCSSAAEAAPLELWTKCSSADPAIQCIVPRGVAANSENGRVFVADSGRGRIVELNARGEFIKAWGWDVVQGGSESFEICVPNSGDVCKAGSTGSGSGQFGSFGSPQGVAVDSMGNIYVVDQGLPSNRRVQKFSPTGQFLRMWGKGVNTGTSGNPNICTNAGPPTDICGAGGSGTGNGEFSWSEEFAASFIAMDRAGTPTDADDTVYVGDVGRIQEFDTSGNFLGQIALPGEIVTGLATDSAGNLYVLFRNKPDVRKLDSSGAPEDPETFPVANPTAVAVDVAGGVYAFSTGKIVKFDEEGDEVESFGQGEFNASTGLATNICPGSEVPGNLYVTNASTPTAFVRAYGTDPLGCFKAVTLPADPIAETSTTLNGSVNPKGETVEECFFRWGETTVYGQTASCVPDAGAIGTGSSPVPVHADLTGLQRGTIYHFRLIARVGGEAEPGSDEVFKTLGPPVISDEHVVSATDTEATLRGLANPEGFATSCHFEYGTTTAYGQSTPAGAIGADRSDHLLTVTLKGLIPGTTYHWRIVCTNSSDTTEGGDRIVATAELPTLDSACSNQAFRTGASAFLPDCRAYEMVSPIDKNGGNILLLSQGNVQAAPDGNKITYNTIPSFGDVQSSYAVNQYLATRTEGGQPDEGWSNHGIHPPVEGRTVVKNIITLGIVRDFLAFTPDLCSAWIYDYLEPSLTPEGQDGYLDLYRRVNCGPGEGDLETLMPEPPPLPQGTIEEYSEPTWLQGISDDGRHAVFLAKTSLLQDCRTTSSANSISYQWLRGGVPIAGATSPVYTPTAEDAGSALQCQVFAINNNAGSTQVANPPSIIPPEPGVTIAPPTAPVSIAAPLPANPIAGTILTCNPGAWVDASSFSFQWYRNGVAILGASSSTYTVQTADVPSAIQCAVTGTNGDGAVTKVSVSRVTSPSPGSVPGSNVSSGGGETTRVYDRSDGELHLVSVLPGGRVASSDVVVGSGAGGSLDNAVSEDGSRIYWVSSFFGEGRIFLRQHPEQGIVADECTDAAKACTVPVTPPLSEAFFWTAATDGSRALYSEGALSNATAELFEFDLNEGGEPQTRSLAKELEGLVGASDDLSRIYFVSREKLTAEAIDGAPNLYLDEGGALTYVATLGDDDVTAEQPGVNLPYDLASREQRLRTTRVSPDGSRLVFQSRAPLTDYDNTDANNGKADVEIFAYEAGGELHCISCNPSGARPVGRELRKPFWSTGPAGHGVFAAAWIPAPEQALHASNVVSADGDRIFFNSNDALLPRDTNGTMDVYQWEALNKGSCDSEDPSYFPKNGGCLNLISTGESPFESEFWEASADGDDVFFTTESSLVPSDPGLVDLYDSRVGGGFPQPIAKEPCEGEACQSPIAAPALPTPASRTYEGPGNVNQVAKGCPKGKRKVRKAGKVRCVKKRKGKSGKAKRRAADNRRAPR
ncbi:MAG: hypothetical protein WA687_04215 [Solirubrobacterales bacterium]